MRNFLLKTAFFSVLLTGSFALLNGCVKEDKSVVLQSIAIKPDTIKIAAGNSLQLLPTFSPSIFSTIPVVWLSADGTIAEVSATGLLLAAKAGITKITIKDKYSATAGTCYVIVQ